MNFQQWCHYFRSHSADATSLKLELERSTWDESVARAAADATGWFIADVRNFNGHVSITFVRTNDGAS